MIRIQVAAATLGVAALMVIATACGGDKTPAESPEVAGGQAPQSASPETQVEPAAPVSGAPVVSGQMAPRPTSAQELVSRSHVIVLGTIRSIIAEKMIGSYGEDGQPLPADDEDGLPFTDYEVQIESVLKGDDAVTEGGTMVLRMFGYASGQDVKASDGTKIVYSIEFQLPSAGDHLLFVLGRNPDGTYGSSPEGLINVDGDTAMFADGVPFGAMFAGGVPVGAKVTPDQLMKDIRDEVSAEQD